LIIKQFQNINLEKDRVNVKGPPDLKNEIRIITLPKDIFALWEEFLNKHAEGKLVNPMTCKPFRDGKNFNPKLCSLKTEFFKHMGHFTDEDL